MDDCIGALRKMQPAPATIARKALEDVAALAGIPVPW